MSAGCTRRGVVRRLVGRRGDGSEVSDVSPAIRPLDSAECLEERSIIRMGLVD